MSAAQPPALYIGVDPGVHGGLGVLDAEAKFVAVYDMPGSPGRDGEFDAHALHAIFSAHRDAGPVRLLVEWPTTRPGEAPESSKRFGVGLGLIWGLGVAHGFEVVREAPAGWKGRLGLSGKSVDPLAARRQAVEYAEHWIGGLPEGALRGPRGGLMDGRAEALLVAWETASRTTAALAAMPPHLREARVLLGGRIGRGRRRNIGI